MTMRLELGAVAQTLVLWWHRWGMLGDWLISLVGKAGEKRRGIW